MKNTQKIIFIITFIIACFSVYSLAEINTNQKINFSGYNNSEFSNNNRKIYGSWNNEEKSKSSSFDVITSKKIISINSNEKIKNIQLPNINFDDEFLIFASLGKVDSYGYNIKIKEITGHGNVVEILTILSNPFNKKLLPYSEQYPYDFVKVNKKDLIIDGELLFIFKDVNGDELYRNKYNIDKNSNII